MSPNATALQTTKEDAGKLACLRDETTYIVQRNGSLRRVPPKPLSQSKLKKLKAKERRHGIDALTTTELTRLAQHGNAATA